MEYYHKPVLLKEVLEILQPAGKTTIVDCTVGGEAGTLWLCVVCCLPAGG